MAKNREVEQKKLESLHAAFWYILHRALKIKRGVIMVEIINFIKKLAIPKVSN